MTPVAPAAQRRRFHGRIAGVGSASGVRVVVGRWDRTPWGPFSDAMVALPSGHRLLLAPTERVADFIASTYTFDEVRVEAFATTGPPGAWSVRSASLDLDLAVGGRTPLGRLLALVPDAVATAPAFCAAVDPVARVVMRGVRTRGSAGHGRREWYGATDHHAVTSLRGALEGRDLGALAPVRPAPDFGFSSTPRRPSVTSVVTTVEVP